MRQLQLIDTTWHDSAPAIRVRDDTGDDHLYPLTPSETFALVRRLVGYLGTLYTPWHEDRTEQSRKANPDLFPTGR